MRMKSLNDGQLLCRRFSFIVTFYSQTKKCLLDGNNRFANLLPTTSTAEHCRSLFLKSGTVQVRQCLSGSASVVIL